MTKLELTDAIRKEIYMTKTEAEAIVNLFFDEMSNALANGDRVKIRRNPKTGKKMKVGHWYFRQI